jgi:hypothetical protein
MPDATIVASWRVITVSPRLDALEALEQVWLVRAVLFC